MHDNEEIKNQEQLQGVASKLSTILKKSLSSAWGDIEKTAVLVHLFKEEDIDTDIRNLFLEGVIEEYVGTKIHEQLPQYLALFDKLKNVGFGIDNSIEVGNDAFVYAIEDRDVVLPKAPVDDMLSELFDAHDIDYSILSQPEVVKAKVLGLTTQSKQYIIVLNERFNKWTFHARKLFPCLENSLAGGYVGMLSAIKDKTDLSIYDVVRLAQHAKDYADDMPGNQYPERLSLTSYLEGTLVAGEESAGRGFRYGDARDECYIVSTKQQTDMNPVAKDITSGSMHDLAYLISYLNVAVEVVCEETFEP